MDAAELEKASLAQHQVRWGAVIDGIFLPDQPSELLRKGKQMPVSILAGHTTADLGPYFAGVDSIEKLKAAAAERLGEDAEEFLHLCRIEDNDLEMSLKLADINHQRLCVEMLARCRARLGMPFYFYRFGPEIPGWDNPGAFHSSDLWFAFETLAKCWRPFVGSHYDLARVMCNYWTNFAKKGDPNGPDADGSPMPQWIAYTEETPWTMELREKPGMHCEAESDAVQFLMDHFLK